MKKPGLNEAMIKLKFGTKIENLPHLWTLIDEIKSCQEALEFYADKENYEQEFSPFEDSGFNKSKVMLDGGDTARLVIEVDKK